VKAPLFGSNFRSFVDHELDGSLELKKSFQKMSSCPEGFFHIRNNFVVSHATSSLVCWILSIGDRHADNLLVSKVSGESIQIDFGYAFGSALFLPIPELGNFIIVSNNTNNFF
jgi:phosphatidylinositol kinase/protein kinase (PI-3  family)